MAPTVVHAQDRDRHCITVTNMQYLQENYCRATSNTKTKE